MARFVQHHLSATLASAILLPTAMHLGLYPVTSTTVTTHIIVTTNLLTLTNVELEALVETKLSDNPALEMADSQPCPRCGALIEKPPCPHCMDELLAKAALNVEAGYRPQAGATRLDDDYDPLMSVVQPTRLADHILRQLSPQLDADAVAIAAYLAESLDERGFLTATVEQVADELKVTPADVEEVLHKLQLADPVGVGSRSPQECLLRQLEALPPAEECAQHLRSVAQQILGEFWESFLHGRWSEIPIPSQQVSAAVSFIRTNLTPYPALAGWEEELARRRGPVASSHYSRPDMAIYCDGDGELAVEIFSVRPSWLRLSPSFREMTRTANGPGRDSWVEMAESARLFIKCLGQRQQTLRRAVDALVRYQEKAIREGDAHVRPLTRTQLAQMLGLHEATVSRAINGKTAALPDGRIVRLSHFFESGKSTKEIIRQMIAEENRPLSDGAIAERLAATGRPIARRTVAKYRNMLDILPVHLRARQKLQAAA